MPSAIAKSSVTTSRASPSPPSVVWLVVAEWSVSLASSTRRPAVSWKYFWRMWSATPWPTPSTPNARPSPPWTWSMLWSVREEPCTDLACKLCALMALISFCYVVDLWCRGLVCSLCELWTWNFWTISNNLVSKKALFGVKKKSEMNKKTLLSNWFRNGWIALKKNRKNSLRFENTLGKERKSAL